MEEFEKKQEALKRMRILRLHENAIAEFSQEGKLNLSEGGGILFWLNDEQEKAVRRIEQKYNILVYHVIRNFTSFGELLTMLYVSNDSEEWESDREDLKDGYTCAYVENLSDKYCSEFGGICFKPRFGGLVRTA